MARLQLRDGHTEQRRQAGFHRGVLAGEQPADLDDRLVDVADEHVAVAILDQAPGRLGVHQTDTVGRRGGLRLGGVHHLQRPQAGKQGGKQADHDDEQDAQSDLGGDRFGSAHLSAPVCRRGRRRSGHHRSGPRPSNPGPPGHRATPPAGRAPSPRPPRPRPPGSARTGRRRGAGSGRARRRVPTQSRTATAVPTSAGRRLDQPGVRQHRGAQSADARPDQAVGQGGQPEGRRGQEQVGDQAGPEPHPGPGLGPAGQTGADGQEDHQVGRHSRRPGGRCRGWSRAGWPPPAAGRSAAGP